MKPSDNDFNIYANFIHGALEGGDPRAADKFLRENLTTIVSVASYILFQLKIEPEKIYRGIIMDIGTIKKLVPDPNFTYLSFTEDYDVAAHFADPTESGFGSLFNLGSYGYIAELQDKNFAIIYHWKFLRDTNLGKIFDEEGLKFLIKQKEVMILQPELPLLLTPYKHFKTKKNPVDLSTDVKEPFKFPKDLGERAIFINEMCIKLEKAYREVLFNFYTKPNAQDLKNAFITAQHLLQEFAELLDRKNSGAVIGTLHERSRREGFYGSMDDIRHNFRHNAVMLITLIKSLKLLMSHRNIWSIERAGNMWHNNEHMYRSKIMPYLIKNFNSAVKAKIPEWMDDAIERESRGDSLYVRYNHKTGVYEFQPEFSARGYDEPEYQQENYPRTKWSKAQIREELQRKQHEKSYAARMKKEHPRSWRKYTRQSKPDLP